MFCTSFHIIIHNFIIYSQSLKDVNKTALEQLVKKIREELGTFGGAEAMFQQPAASEATALPRTSNYCADIIVST
jgi:hypothetical protein